MPILPKDTLSYVINLVNRANSDPVIQSPLSSSTFTLDSSGVAGFFGGESAVRAMSTVYLIPQRRWLGWYNAPGAYEVAKQYSGLAKSHIFNGLFPGYDRDPAKILMVDNQVGPEYTSLYSPTRRAPSSIGHLGSLIARKVSQMPVTFPVPLPKKNATDPCWVTFVNLLRRTLPDELNKQELNPSSSIIFTVFIIAISAGGCITCALIADWFCFASIALGIIANGVACLIIGSGKLYLYLKDNAPHRVGSRGDILLRSNTNIIVLAGDEGIGRSFTHGRFIVQRLIPHFGPEEAGANDIDTQEPNFLISMIYSSQRILQKCLTVDVSVILLLLQFLAQLLLIPQGKLFGQVMFIVTLVPSWMYHSYLSTLGLDLQTDVLFKTLSIQKTDVFKYRLNTSTQAAVFACLIFRSIHKPTWLMGSEDLLGVHAAGQIAEEEADTLAISQAKDVETAANEARTKARDAADVARRIARAAGRAEMEAASAATRARAEAAVTVEEAAVEALNERPDSDRAIEVARKKLEAERLALEAVKKAEEAARARAEEAVRTNALVAPEEEAERAEEAVRQAVAAQEVNKGKREVKNKRKEQDNNRRKKQKDAADKALWTLLDQLLPDQTDVWRAFKESLVRKLSATTQNNSDWSWTYMERNWTFDFNETQDSWSVCRVAGVSGP